MFIETLVVGPLQNNCYIIADKASEEAMVVDPGDEPDRIMDVIRENNLELKYIVATHGHFDHIGAVGDIKAETSAEVVLHKDELRLYNAAVQAAASWGFEVESQPEPDMFVKEGDTLRLGNLSFDILHTPGHSPGGICLYTKGLVITGDTLFAGSVGRTDLPGGDIEKLKLSFRRLMDLPDETRVLCGHGPESTIRDEKTDNMFIEEFMS